MTTLILLRHGRSTANTAGVLAGRTPGVELDETGRGAGGDGRRTARGAPDRGDRLLARCCAAEQTVAPLAAARGLTPVTEPDLAEVDYGAWTGAELKELGKETALEGRAGAPVGRGVPRRRGPRGDAGPGGGRGTPARGADHRRARPAARSGSRAATATSSSRCWPTRWPRTWTTSSASWSTPARSASCTTPRRDRSCARVNDLGGDVAGLVPPAPKRRRRTAARSSDAVVGGNRR